MRKHGLILIVLLMTLVFASTTQAQYDSNLPIPCINENSPDVYLIIDYTRRHIADWDTFLNLGYTQDQIVPCDADAEDPLGDSITRLFKGSGSEIYWMQNGSRRYIPDMDTFAAMGFRTNAISELPDDVIREWPLGGPLQSSAMTPGDSLYDERVIGDYTIRLWHPGQGLTDYATLTSPYQETETRVNDVESIGELPYEDMTGDGYPEIEFLTRYPGSHCCTGTVIYDLNSYLDKVMDIHSQGDQPQGGRGDFIDVDGDGAYEFVLQDPLSGIACTQPSVTAILSYDYGQQKYVGASTRFPDYYRDEITQFTTQAASGDHCDVYPLITTLLYMGKQDQAQTAYEAFYHADDAATFWVALQTSVENGRFYVVQPTG